MCNRSASIYKLDVNVMKKVERCSCSASRRSTLLVLLVFTLFLLVVWTASNKPVTYFTLRPDAGTRRLFTANSKYSYTLIISFSYKYSSVAFASLVPRLRQLAALPFKTVSHGKLGWGPVNAPWFRCCGLGIFVVGTSFRFVL